MDKYVLKEVENGWILTCDVNDILETTVHKSLTQCLEFIDIYDHQMNFDNRNGMGRDEAEKYYQELLEIL